MSGTPVSVRRPGGRQETAPFGSGAYLAGHHYDE